MAEVIKTPASRRDSTEDGDFVRRTYRSALWVSAFVLFVLASYGQFWALLPVAAGMGLGLALLRTLEWLVRGLFTPERAREARRNAAKKGGPKGALVMAALVKYPLVALVLWAVTRFWDPREILAFVGGFVLLQAVIVLRGVGSYLVERMKDNDARRPLPEGDRHKRAL